MMGFTSAAKALLVTVLQSTEGVPPPPPLLQEMPIKTNAMHIDAMVRAFLMLICFQNELNPSDVK